MERNVNITKAKLNKGLHLEVEYSEQIQDGIMNISQKCSADVHDDLRAAFNGLSKHFARLTEQYTPDGELCEQMVCRGFSIKGEDEDERVVLTGLRHLSNNKALILNSPYIKLSSEEDIYPNIDDLNERLDIVKREIELYLFENKHSPDAQGRLFEEEDLEEMDEVTE